MTNESNGEGPTTQNVVNTIESIYHEVVTSSAEVGQRLKSLIDDNSDQYLTVRDDQGRVLIRLSLAGGIILVMMSLFINRLRWTVLVALFLMSTRMRISFESDQERSGLERPTKSTQRRSTESS